MVLAILGLIAGIAIGWMLAMQKVASYGSQVKDITPAAPVAMVQETVLKPEWLAALGGQGNIQDAEFIAATRVRVEMRDGSQLNEAALQQAGIAALARISPQIVHLIM